MNRIKQSPGDRVFGIVNFAIVTLFMILIVYPLVFVLSASFSDPERVIKSSFVLLPLGFTLENYSLVLGNPDIWTGYGNTLFYTVAYTVLSLFLTVLCAYPLSRPDFYGKKLFMALFIITMYFSGGLIPFYILIKQLGMINTRWSIVIPGALSVYNMIVLRTYFMYRIPVEMQESAVIDGCGVFRMLWKVILPLSKPILAVMVLFYAVGMWNSYFSAMIYLTKRELFPLQLILREILVKSDMEKMFPFLVKASSKVYQKEGIKYATAVASSLPLLLIYPFFKRFFEEGILLGSLKG